jgi:hypothetical protein
MNYERGRVSDWGQASNERNLAAAQARFHASSLMLVFQNQHEKVATAEKKT